MPFLRCSLIKFKVCIAIVLVVNVAMGIALVKISLSRGHGTTSDKAHSTARETYFFKREIDEVYDAQPKNVFISEPVNAGISDDATLEFLSLLKPVSQQSGLEFQDSKNGNPDNTDLRILRIWANNEGTERNLLWNGMTYENGSVTVPANGIYHVHSHVKFFVEANDASDLIKHFQHRVIRFSVLTGHQELVAANVVSECKEGINYGAHLEYASDIGSLVHLNVGDQIAIKVTDSFLLRQDNDWHSFGIYLI